MEDLPEPAQSEEVPKLKQFARAGIDRPQEDFGDFSPLLLLIHDIKTHAALFLMVGVLLLVGTGISIATDYLEDQHLVPLIELLLLKLLAVTLTIFGVISTIVISAASCLVTILKLLEGVRKSIKERW